MIEFNNSILGGIFSVLTEGIVIWQKLLLYTDATKHQLIGGGVIGLLAGMILGSCLAPSRDIRSNRECSGCGSHGRLRSERQWRENVPLYRSHPVRAELCRRHISCVPWNQAQRALAKPKTRPRKRGPILSL